ncbi:MAG: hypothetical protein A2007_00825 [Verrucomicrobia bacterium GWC2_42_7]|nr:MAG: hypothetical protein A2007_00825 [Verrucomicrobia bacterium GWC2_42_7]
MISGCAYHPGAPKLQFKSIYIRPATNKTFVPQFQALLTQQVAQSFLQEGNIAVVENDEADVTLIIEVGNYTRGMAATQASDTALAKAVALGISVQCSLIDNEKEKALFENRTIFSDIRVLVNEDYLTSEYQSMSELARSIALKIKNSVISTW